ncbi:MAG: zinc-ribbon domain-containing protein [Ruminobacter sp.]|nr:zinc-ribbon domain-containing protein [Ruminobacter sp.]
MICPFCHKEISDNSNFCPECGKKLQADAGAQNNR